MNEQNKEMLMNDVEDVEDVEKIETNVGEEQIVLATPTALLDEAGEIAERTSADQKFPFALQYDANEKEHLLSMLRAVDAVVEKNDEKGHVLSTRMNMTQLAFIKRLDCVERVMTDEGSNPLLEEETMHQTAEATQAAQVMTLAAGELEAGLVEEGIEQTSEATVASTCGSCSNTTMETAQTIEVEETVFGGICCPGAEQWFKFTVPENGFYTIHTRGSLDTVGTLYDSEGDLIEEVDDYNGKINFRIMRTLQANQTYYLCVTAANSNTGGYTLRVTEKILADSVSINPSKFVLEKGKSYELPLSPNYTYQNLEGTERIDGLSARVFPMSANEQRVLWTGANRNICTIDSGWNGDQGFQKITATGVGATNLSVRDWYGDGQLEECTFYVSKIIDSKVTVLSCSPSPWIASSQTMGRDMAAAFNCEGSYIVETPKTVSEFETCWIKANECIVIHTHGSANTLNDEYENTTPVIITNSEVENLPVNNKIRFIMMTACETAGGAVNDNIAYWLSKRINPNGIVIANMDSVKGSDREFLGAADKPTWKIYKNGVIQNAELPVILTMPGACEIYKQYQ